MKKALAIIFAVLFVAACTTKKPLPENPNQKIKELSKAEKYDDALNLIDRVINEKENIDAKEKYSLLRTKFGILSHQKKYDKALPVAMEIEKTSERKSPYRCLSVAECYLQLNKTKESIEWINKAIDLGFKSLSYFEEEPYSKIKQLDVYSDLVQKIKDNIGIGKTPKDFTVETISGKKVTLSKLKGKVVMIDFWATWCPPCRKEIPNLVKLYNANNKKGFEIIGISLDFKDKLQQVKDFMKEKGMKWEVSYSGKGWNTEISKLYGVNSIPSVWLVDKKGVLRYFDIHGEELEAKILELIKE